MSRALAGLLAVTMSLLAAGCSDDEPTPRTALPTEAPARWNPCDGLDPAAVAESFGTTFSVVTGTDEEPRCSFSPREEGAPALDVNYQLYPGTMAELIDTFGTLAEGARTRVTGPDLASADDARIIVDVSDGTLAVTGLVQNGALVQVVNALDPSPFDRGLMTRGVRTVLAELAVHAGDSGLG